MRYARHADQHRSGHTHPVEETHANDEPAAMAPDEVVHSRGPLLDAWKTRQHLASVMASEREENLVAEKAASRCDQDHRGQIKQAAMRSKACHDQDGLTLQQS